MARDYFTLVVREDGRWGQQFGDYDREVVAQEIEDSYGDVRKADRKIIRTKPGQADVNAKVAALNSAPATVRLTVVREPAGQYVTAGESYTVSNPALVGSRGDVRFWRDEIGAGTIMPVSIVRMAIKSGWIVPEVKPVKAGPVAILVAQTIHWSLSPVYGAGSDLELQRSERDTSMDIAEVLGASIIRSGMAVVRDTLCTAGV